MKKSIILIYCIIILINLSFVSAMFTVSGKIFQTYPPYAGVSNVIVILYTSDGIYVSKDTTLSDGSYLMQDVMAMCGKNYKLKFFKLNYNGKTEQITIPGGCGSIWKNAYMAAGADYDGDTIVDAIDSDKDGDGFTNDCDCEPYNPLVPLPNSCPDWVVPSTCCGDGLCDSGENCPSDVGSCPASLDTRCYEPACTYGCTQVKVANGQHDELCISPSYCDGNGNCVSPPACNHDGIRNAGEVCDDGNYISGDGCENDCTITVGDWSILYPNAGLTCGQVCSGYSIPITDANCKQGYCGASFVPNGCTTGTQACPKFCICAPNDVCGDFVDYNGDKKIEDCCMDDTTLAEATCSGYEFYTCPNGCENGKCITDVCKEAILNHNNLNENRINIIFVSINYLPEEYNKFIYDINDAIDNDHKSDFGILSLEPFKSNKDKFNFWYVSEIGNVDYSQTTYNENNEINRLTDKCYYKTKDKNKEVIVLINRDFASYAIDWDDSPEVYTISGTGGRAVISASEYYHNTLNSNLILTHEFGHTFGIFDEYVFSLTNSNRGGIYTPGKSLPTKNCFYSTKISCDTANCYSTADSIKDCEENAPWKDLIGNGCGQDGIVDCDTSNPNYILEVSCQNLGCDYINTYRATYNSLINLWKSLNLDIVDQDYTRSFGPYNERIICKRIKAKTGSVGGICNNLCLVGCPNGQRCIEGICELV